MTNIITNNARAAKEQGRRAKIMKKAFNLMAKKGIEEVSMREIAAACGVSKPVLYYYFKDKEDLCKSIIGENVTDFHSDILEDMSAGRPLKEICQKAFALHQEYFYGQPKNVSFVIHVMSYAAKEGKKSARRFIEIKKERKEMFEKLFKHYEKIGQIPKGSYKDLAHMLSAGLAHIMVNSLSGYSYKFEADFPQKFTEIMFLGLNEFYKRNKK